jgi:hypothetical protein
MFSSYIEPVGPSCLICQIGRDRSLLTFKKSARIMGWNGLYHCFKCIHLLNCTVPVLYFAHPTVSVLHRCTSRGGQFPSSTTCFWNFFENDMFLTFFWLPNVKFRIFGKKICRLGPKYDMFFAFLSPIQRHRGDSPPLCTYAVLYLDCPSFCTICKIYLVKKISFHWKPKRSKIKNIYGSNEFLTR